MYILSNLEYNDGDDLLEAMAKDGRYGFRFVDVNGVLYIYNQFTAKLYKRASK